MQVVVFSLGQSTYAVEALAVQEIIRRPEYTTLPEAPRHILGLMDFRGLSIPLIHLGHMLSVSAAEEGLRAIVVGSDGFVTAFMVDDVDDVLNLPPESIEPVPSIVSSPFSVPKAVARIKGRLIIVIDPIKLLIRGQELFKQTSRPLFFD
ncbi:MAG: CheW protein [Bacillota bacterium]|nr:MAG: CheW protein [Bacillota bacterium]MBS3949691.1 purine-binding chemotaxis protein CheW [Peptococcaceae bacterium]